MCEIEPKEIDTLFNLRAMPKELAAILRRGCILELNSKGEITMAVVPVESSKMLSEMHVVLPFRIETDYIGRIHSGVVKAHKEMPEWQRTVLNKLAVANEAMSAADTHFKKEVEAEWCPELITLKKRAAAMLLRNSCMTYGDIIDLFKEEHKELQDVIMDFRPHGTNSIAVYLVDGNSGIYIVDLDLPTLRVNTHMQFAKPLEDSKCLAILKNETLVAGFEYAIKDALKEGFTSKDIKMLINRLLVKHQ
jgi:hypothetical protein